MKQNKTTILSIISWACRLLSAGIMGQTLFFKFSGAAESIYIFTRVGMEPWGRWGTGSVELVASLLLLWTTYAWLGSFLAATVMFGAIFSHLTLLGIVVQDDGGQLFTLACIVFVASMTNLYLQRQNIPLVGEMLTGDKSNELTHNLVSRLSLKNVRLGYLFLAVCVLIALTGIVQEVYTLSKITSLSPTLAPEIRSVVQVAYFLTILGVLFSFLLAMALLRVVGKPISNFTDVCRLIVSGEKNARVATTSSVELSLMASSFNKMLDDLQQKDANIRSLLDGISDAVFFFDEKGEISREASRATALIFPKLAACTNVSEFFQLDFSRTSDSTVQTLKLFWDPNCILDFGSIADLFPKRGQIPDETLTGGMRYVSLKYRSENSPDGALKRIVVVATDRTEEELASRESAAQRERISRLSMITSNLSDFQASLEEIEGIWTTLFSELKKTTKERTQDWESIVRRQLHSLKGGLAAYEFKTLAEQVHHLETKLVSKPLTELGPQINTELDTIQTAFKSSLSDIDQVLSLQEEKKWIKISAAKFNKLQCALKEKQDPQLFALFASLREQGLDKLLSKYDRYLQTLSEKDGTKMVSLRVLTDSDEVNPESVLSLSSSLGHLVRNFFDHGIEPGDEREANGKPAEGIIEVKAKKTPAGQLELTLRDDGRGIQTGRLVEKAIASGHWTADKAQAASDQEKVDLIFASGLSTKEAVSETSGRGVGMDAVRADIEGRQGKIVVQTWLNKGTEFKIILPLS